MYDYALRASLREIMWAKICHCLLPDRTWHKVNDLKIDYSEGLGDRKVRHKLRIEPCWTMIQLALPNNSDCAWTSVRALERSYELPTADRACLYKAKAESHYRAAET